MLSLPLGRRTKGTDIKLPRTTIQQGQELICTQGQNTEYNPPISTEELAEDLPPSPPGPKLPTWGNGQEVKTWTMDSL